MSAAKAGSSQAAAGEALDASTRRVFGRRPTPAASPAPLRTPPSGPILVIIKTGLADSRQTVIELTAISQEISIGFGSTTGSSRMSLRYNAARFPVRRGGASITAHEVRISAAGGEYAALDYGGAGSGVLCIHDLTENAAVWDLVGPAVAEFARPVAVDLPAHGRTAADIGPDPSRWWSRLGDIAKALDMPHPVVVGQGFGAWGAVAATVAGALEPAGLVLLEGVYPWEREQAAAYLAQLLEPGVVESLAQRYALGMVIEESGREAFLDAVVHFAQQDWMTSQIPAPVIRAIADRALWPLHDGEPTAWLRRPTLADMLALAHDPAGRDPFPCLETYLKLPEMTSVVMASDGVLADGDHDVWHLLWLRPEWSYQVVDAIRNVSAAHAEVVVRAVFDLLD